MYSIEDNLDFYKMIYDEDDVGNNDENCEKNDDKKVDSCLITNDELTKNHITLSCNHKFNYKPLLKDVYTRLYMSHNSKCSNCISNVGILQCPYCRQGQFMILPYIPDEYEIKIYGVNTDDIQYKIIDKYLPFYKLTKCSMDNCVIPCYSGYKTLLCKKHGMNKNTKEKNRCTFILQKGVRKGQKCDISYTGNEGLCKRHKKICII